MKRVAVAGNLILDVMKRIESFPQIGMLANIGETSYAVGGCVCNTAIDLKRLCPDFEVSAFGKVGDDDYARYILNTLTEAGLNTSNVKKGTLPTSYTDVMTLPGGERTFFHFKGANSEFGIGDARAENADLFHLGYLLLLDALDAADKEYGTAAARLLAETQARGIETSIDLVSAQTADFNAVVKPALRFCDYVVMNEVEGGMLAGVDPRGVDGAPILKNLRRICEVLIDTGVKRSVTIHCPELSCALDCKGRFSVLSSLNLPKGYIVGTVGAGDAFCAGMLYSFCERIPLGEGMRIASCAAACNLAAIDSVSGAKGLEESLSLEKIYGRRKMIC